MRTAFLTALILIEIHCLSLVSSFSYEKKLIKELMNNYTNTGLLGRPVRNSTQKLTVEYGLSLIQLLDLNEIDQILTIKVWARFTWIDELLTWNPALYNNVNEIRIPPKKMWLPDIVLYNYADERMSETRDVMCVINHVGRVTWMPPAIYKSTCSIDIRNFPFDEQACHLAFGSFTYSNDKLDVQFMANETEVNLDNYVKNNEWIIKKGPARRNTKDAKFPQLVFFLFLKRNSAFFAYLLVLPCVLLSSLTLVAFWLPYAAPAKILLGINIFSAFFLLLLLLAKSTPSASVSIPYLGYYYSLNMLLITLSTFLAATVTNVFFRSDKRQPMPTWLKKRLIFCSRLLCIATEEDLPMATATLRLSGSKRERISSILPSRSNGGSAGKGANVKLSGSGASAAAPASSSATLTVTVPRLSNKSPGNVPCTCQFCAKPYFGKYSAVAGGAGQCTCRNSSLAEQQPEPNSLSEPVQPLKQSFNTRGNITVPPTSTSKSASSISRALETSLLEVNNAIRQTMTRLSNKDSKMRKTKEWQLVSLVLDRILFWCFCCFILIAGFVLLMPKSTEIDQAAFIKKYAPVS